MELVVNAAAYTHTGDGTLADLIREMGAETTRAAVVLNGDLVVSARWEETVLNEGDRVEVVVFVGGG